MFKRQAPASATRKATEPSDGSTSPGVRATASSRQKTTVSGAAVVAAAAAEGVPGLVTETGPGRPGGHHRPQRQRATVGHQPADQDRCLTRYDQPEQRRGLQGRQDDHQGQDEQRRQPHEHRQDPVHPMIVAPESGR
ncbi:hypothetical protein DLJ57_01310 [Micromonospora chalcea]|nr:hypothetical protein DLJ57_01310 [Micromonospora chalcea]